MKTKTKPCRARFIGKHGYPGQAEAASKLLTTGKTYTITDARVGGSYSTVQVGGQWFNSVLFSVSVARLVKCFPHAFGYRLSPPHGKRGAGNSGYLSATPSD